MAKARQKIKALHALNWLYGNICARKCYRDEEKQRGCYAKMKGIIAGHEDFLITHKIFITVMREKHCVCDLGDEKFYGREPNFWPHQYHGK